MSLSAEAHSVLLQYNIPWCEYSSLFAHPPVDGHLGVSNVLAIRNSAGGNILAGSLRLHCGPVFQGKMPRRGFAVGPLLSFHSPAPWDLSHRMPSPPRLPSSTPPAPTPTPFTW